MKLNTFQDFPDNRLTGDTSLRQIQLVMLRLLKIFDKICQEYNLTYWVDAGTLLGAIRHKGFIPWDDDLDVIMPYEDYLKFLKLPATVFPDDVFLQTENTDKERLHRANDEIQRSDRSDHCRCCRRKHSSRKRSRT